MPSKLLETRPRPKHFPHLWRLPYNLVNKPWSETACSPWLSPNAKLSLGLQSDGVVLGVTVNPTWCGHYFCARSTRWQRLEAWNHFHAAASCKMHDAVSMQRIKHCVNPHGQSLRVIFTLVKDTEAFQFTHVAVSASEINLWFIKYWKNLSLAQIIMIKLSGNSSAAMVTKCQCAWGWGLLQDRSMRRSVITAQHLNLRAQSLLI